MFGVLAQADSTSAMDVISLLGGGGGGLAAGVAVWLWKQHKSVQEQIATIVKQVDELHEWHSVKDEDGVPVWYIRKSLERVIEQLGHAITRQTDVLSKMIEELRDVRRDVKSLSKGS